MKPEELKYPENQRGWVWRFYWNTLYWGLKNVDPVYSYALLLYVFQRNQRWGILPFDIGTFLATGERIYLTDWLQDTP